MSQKLLKFIFFYLMLHLSFHFNKQIIIKKTEIKVWAVMSIFRISTSTIIKTALEEAKNPVKRIWVSIGIILMPLGMIILFSILLLPMFSIRRNNHKVKNHNHCLLMILEILTKFLSLELKLNLAAFDSKDKILEVFQKLINVSGRCRILCKPLKLMD